MNKNNKNILSFLHKGEISKTRISLYSYLAIVRGNKILYFKTINQDLIFMFAHKIFATPTISKKENIFKDLVNFIDEFQNGRILIIFGNYFIKELKKIYKDNIEITTISEYIYPISNSFLMTVIHKKSSFDRVLKDNQRIRYSIDFDISSKQKNNKRLKDDETLNRLIDEFHKQQNSYDEYITKIVNRRRKLKKDTKREIINSENNIKNSEKIIKTKNIFTKVLNSIKSKF